MAKTRVFTGPLVNYTGGTYGPFNIPDWATDVRIGLARNTSATPLYWPDPATVVSTSLECSVDAGANWVKLTSWRIPGGLIRRVEDLSEVEESWGGGGPLPLGSNRMVRGDVVVTGPPLRSEFRIEVL